MNGLTCEAIAASNEDDDADQYDLFPYHSQEGADEIDKNEAPDIFNSNDSVLPSEKQTDQQKSLEVDCENLEKENDQVEPSDEVRLNIDENEEISNRLENENDCILPAGGVTEINPQTDAHDTSQLNITVQPSISLLKSCEHDKHNSGVEEQCTRPTPREKSLEDEFAGLVLQKDDDIVQDKDGNKFVKVVKCVFRDYFPQGSLVAVKLVDLPTLWPAMIDVDPNHNGHFIVESRPSRLRSAAYHVTLLGDPVTRAWVFPSSIYPITSLKNSSESPGFTAALEMLNKVQKLPRIDRCDKWGFLVRYPGKVKEEPADEPMDSSSNQFESAAPIAVVSESDNCSSETEIEKFADTELSVPELMEPELTEPELTEPELAEAGLAEAETSEPGVDVPNPADHDLADLDLAERELAEPELTETGVEEHGLAVTSEADDTQKIPDLQTPGSMLDRTVENSQSEKKPECPEPKKQYGVVVNPEYLALYENVEAAAKIDFDRCLPGDMLIPAVLHPPPLPDLLDDDDEEQFSDDALIWVYRQDVFSNDSFVNFFRRRDLAQKVKKIAEAKREAKREAIARASKKEMLDEFEEDDFIEDSNEHLMKCVSQSQSAIVLDTTTEEVKLTKKRAEVKLTKKPTASKRPKSNKLPTVSDGSTKEVQAKGPESTDSQTGLDITIDNAKLTKKQPVSKRPKSSETSNEKSSTTSLHKPPKRAKFQAPKSKTAADSAAGSMDSHPISNVLVSSPVIEESFMPPCELYPITEVPNELLAEIEEEEFVLSEEEFQFSDQSQTMHPNEL